MVLKKDDTLETTKQNDATQSIGIICFSALPYQESWGSAQRIHYMANALATSYNVTVFASKCTDIKHNEDIKREYNTIFYDDKLSKKLFIINNATTPKSNEVKRSNRLSIKAFIRSTAITVLRKVNSVFYNEPTYFKGLVSENWIRKNGDLIIRNIQKNRTNVLIISIPPFNLLSVPFIRKVKSLGCKVIVDYRDPWNCWNNHSGLPLKKERKIAHIVDAIFVTNQSHAQKIEDDLKINSEKIHVVMNGYDAEKWDNISIPEKSDSNLLEIAFIGSIQFGNQNSFRDPSNFIKALDAFEYKDKIRFRVIGCKDDAVISSMRSKIPKFEMVDSVPQTESFKWMMKSDVLVNFHTTKDDSSKYLIAGKIFDYYRSGAKILSINGPQSYERHFVEKTNSGYFCTNDVTKILETLRKIYFDWELDKSKFRRDVDINLKYSRQFQNKLAKTIIDNIIHQKH